MSIADRIAAAQADIEEFNGILNERNTALTKVADQENMLTTAALQHGNDQQEIANANADIAVLSQAIQNLKLQLTTDDALVANVRAQLAQLQSTVTYPDLEWGQWMMNIKPDAASGRGVATLSPADDLGTPAVFSISPFIPLAGDKDNFFNAYATQKKKPNAAVTNFVLRGQFDFPTDVDMKNAHCIELEARQVLKTVAPALLPLMAVPAFQCNFSGNEFRYFQGAADSTSGWKSTGLAMPRQRTVAVVMEAHRDEKTLYYDAFTINGQRHAVSFQAPLYAKTYVNERLSVSLQLDSHYLGGAFKVIPSGVSLGVR